MTIRLLQLTVAALLMGSPVLILRFRAAARRAAAELIRSFERQMKLDRDLAQGEMTRVVERVERADQLLSDTVSRLETESREAFARGTQYLTEECAGLRVEVERAREIAGAETAKVTRYFNKISDFERA